MRGLRKDERSQLEERGKYSEKVDVKEKNLWGKVEEAGRKRWNNRRRVPRGRPVYGHQS